MDENKSKSEYGAIRLKYSTIDTLKRLKLTMEASGEKEMTYDEFVNLLISYATKSR